MTSTSPVVEWLRPSGGKTGRDRRGPFAPRSLDGNEAATGASRPPIPHGLTSRLAHGPSFFLNASLSAMVSRDSSTTACRNLIFSASRNDRILIGRLASSSSPRSCDCRSTALEPTVLGFNTDTEFIATLTLFEGTVAWRIIAGSATAACELAHTPADEHPDLVAVAAAKVRSVPPDARAG
jgi:hypothetical protein